MVVIFSYTYSSKKKRSVYIDVQTCMPEYMYNLICTYRTVLHNIQVPFTCTEKLTIKSLNLVFTIMYDSQIEFRRMRDFL